MWRRSCQRQGSTQIKSPVAKFALACRPHNVTEHGIDLLLPALAAEHAVMADSGLEMVALARGREPGQEVVGRGGLADGADIVAFALHRQQQGIADLGEVDTPAAIGEAAL